MPITRPSPAYLKEFDEKVQQATKKFPASGTASSTTSNYTKRSIFRSSIFGASPSKTG